MKKNIWIGIAFCILFLAVVVVPISYSWTGQEKAEVTVELLQVTYGDGLSTVTGTLVNQTDHDIDVSSFLLTLFDSTKQVFQEPLYIGSVLRKGESKPFQVQVTEDFSMVSDASYQLVK